MDERDGILVVDDDEQVRGLLEEYLGDRGYDVRTAADAQAARTLLGIFQPRLALLDLSMPGEDGLSLARHIREHLGIGIIIVTGTADTMDRIVGLEVGADDYIAKPFDNRELLARIRSVLRRIQPAANKPDPAPARRQMRFGAFTLDLDTRCLLAEDGREVPITAMEFDLLKLFGERPNRVLTRDEILDSTQNREWSPYDRSVDIRIARLRKKIEPDADPPRLLRTVRGAGYMYVPAAR